ncbi:Opioid growth factor receptor [Galemys pyrenaicus]|uniref:Opioid growth factor receptor n=1 Tax=Galemys pyrenaicus TaxID=202257 RepID=A0A8J6DP62_GALPY|nr:Opioid growth factor receptor [Galemys pyrenaicus]
MDDPGCDSTWEEDDEEDGGSPDAGGDEDGEAGAPGDADEEDADDEAEDGARAARPSALQSRMTGSRNWRAMRDTCRYRHRYPDLVEGDGDEDMPNLSFYKNETCFLPNGCLIEDFLQHWRNDYGRLEDNHSYIQWLFPLREPGVNWHAKPLTLQEVEAFKSSEEVRGRLVQAYELMLGFYGIQLKDRRTGQVCRAHNYQKRFQNLNRHSHNNLRITRILKSLGELGLEGYQAPLARFFLEETLVRKELPAVRQSALDYFVFTVRCRRQRRQLLRFAWEHFRPRREFVWGPHDKLRRLRLSAPPEGEASPGGPLPETGAQGPVGEPRGGRGGAGVPAGASPQEAGARQRAQGEEACARGQADAEPPGLTESKKRKLEPSQPERAPGGPDPRRSAEVEEIALDLQDCALSQGSLDAGSQDASRQAPGAAEGSGAQPPRTTGAAEVRKRRRVDRGAPGGSLEQSAATCAPVQPSAQSGRPEAREDARGVEDDAGLDRPEQVAPGSPAAAADEEAASPEPRSPARAGQP